MISSIVILDTIFSVFIIVANRALSLLTGSERQYMNFKNCQKHAVMWVVVCARFTSKSRKTHSNKGIWEYLVLLLRICSYSLLPV